MEPEPKTPSRLVWWLLIPLGMLLLYVLGMAPLLGLADRWLMPDAVTDGLLMMNGPIQAAASVTEVTEEMEQRYRQWWDRSLSKPLMPGFDMPEVSR